MKIPSLKDRTKNNRMSLNLLDEGQVMSQTIIKVRHTEESVGK